MSTKYLLRSCKLLTAVALSYTCLLLYISGLGLQTEVTVVRPHNFDAKSLSFYYHIYTKFERTHLHFVKFELKDLEFVEFVLVKYNLR